MADILEVDASGRLLPSGAGLSDEQREALDLEHHVVVVAGAGSGKTKTLTRRVVRILGLFAWEAALAGAPRARGPEAVLVCTFTERASGEMRSRIRAELGDAVRELMDREVELGASLAAAGRDGATLVAAVLRHLRSAREGFDHARIGTFHGFAAATLREFAAEAGLDPGFVVLEAADERLLRESAARGALEEEERQRPNSVLFDAFGRRTLLDALRIWVQRRHDLAPFAQEVLLPEDDLLAAWQRRYADVALCELEADAGRGSDLEGALVRFVDLQDHLRPGANRPPALLAGLQLLDRMDLPPPGDAATRSDRLRAMAALARTGSGRGHFAKASAPWTGRAADYLSPARAREASAAWAEVRVVLERVFGPAGERFDTLLGAPDRVGVPVLKALAALGEQAMARYATALRAARGLDFAELEARLLGLLEGSPSVRSRLQRRFRHVLVDEFQDTNTTQWRVVRRLLGAPLPKAGLFLVGDPKQAIYRFRGGDVTVFERARRELAHAGARELSFTANFRSRPAVIDGFNRLFGWAMPAPTDDAPPWEARFEALSARRSLDPADHEPGRLDAFWLGAPDTVAPARPPLGDAALAEEDDEPEAPPLLGLLNLPPAHREARVVAALIRQILLPGSDVHEGVRVAVLLRRRTHLSLYARALREEGVPHVVGRGRGFFGRQEVADFANLLLALAFPDDAIALLGALRGPFLALEDALLPWLALLGREAGPDALGVGWRRVLAWSRADAAARVALEDALGWSAVPEALRGMLAGAADRFVRWRALIRELPLSAFLRLVVRETAAVYGLAHSDPTGQAMGNIDKLIALALNYDARGAEGLADFAEFLRRQDDAEGDEGEAILDATAPVVLMTVHQSKGLEFPVVVLPDLSQSLRLTDSDPLTLARLPSAELREAQGAELWEAGIAVPVVADGVRERQDMLLRRLIVRQDAWEDIAESRRVLYVAATRARDRLVTVAQPLTAAAAARVAAGDVEGATSWSEWLRLWLTTQAPGAPSLRVFEIGPDKPFPPAHLIAEARLRGAWHRLQGREYAPAPDSTLGGADIAAVARSIAPIAASPLRRTSPHALQRTDGPREATGSAAPRPPAQLPAAEAGRLRGLLVHACLEDGLLRAGVHTRARARAALVHAGLWSADGESWLHDALVRHLRGFARGAPPELLADGATVFREVPFRLALPPHAMAGDGPAWLDGVIDVLYRRPADQCWWVLDYKSDEAPPAGLASGYAPQILAYAWAASQILPELADPSWRVGGELLFTAAGARIEVVDPAPASVLAERFAAELRASRPGSPSPLPPLPRSGPPSL